MAYTVYATIKVGKQQFVLEKPIELITHYLFNVCHWPHLLPA